MKATKIKAFYRRNLPHFQPIGAAFFVTFRLKGSIPKNKLFKLKQDFEDNILQLKMADTLHLEKAIYDEHKRFFAKYDSLLDNIKTGPHHLKKPEIASIVIEQMHRHDGELYELVAYCVMSNHVHLLIDTGIQLPKDPTILDIGQLDFEPLENIMKTIKGASSRYANLELGQKGTFWQNESYDHYVRNERELNNIIGYILDNPVKAKLVKKWEQYPFSYLQHHLPE